MNFGPTNPCHDPSCSVCHPNENIVYTIIDDAGGSSASGGGGACAPGSWECELCSGRHPNHVLKCPKLEETARIDGIRQLEAPLKCHLPDASADRKNLPIGEFLRTYFPKAIAYAALVAKRGNDQHNPGEPMHWAREKSSDHTDCIARHLLDAGAKDGKGIRHSGGLVWRALANLQLELEKAERNGEQWWKDGE